MPLTVLAQIAQSVLPVTAASTISACSRNAPSSTMYMDDRPDRPMFLPPSPVIALPVAGLMILMYRLCSPSLNPAGSIHHGKCRIMILIFCRIVSGLSSSSTSSVVREPNVVLKPGLNSHRCRAYAPHRYVMPMSRLFSTAPSSAPVSRLSIHSMNSACRGNRSNGTIAGSFMAIRRGSYVQSQSLHQSTMLSAQWARIAARVNSRSSSVPSVLDRSRVLTRRSIDVCKLLR